MHEILFPRPSLPVVAGLSVTIDDGERRAIARLAERLRADEPALAATGAFGPLVVSGIGAGPAVLLEDHSAIALADRSGDSSLEYRSLFLAADGDIMVIGQERDTTFEGYVLDLLGLRHVDVVCPDSDRAARPRSLAERCHADPAVLTVLVEAARQARGLTLLPYMGTGHLWTLGRAIAEHSGFPVHVAAAPPRLVRSVNDKLWFARRVVELLGHRALPATFSAYGPAALSGRVHALARDTDRIVIKLPDSSGAEGNLVLDAKPLRNMPLGRLHRRLERLLRSLGWRGSYPLALGVWDSPVCESPSVQVWVPERDAGPPIIQAIFSQIVTGERGEFVGAVASELPEAWQDRLGREALVLSTLFQELGYFGQCSFDAVIAGEDLRRARLHWIECNGRWGGVSIPLIIANRLNGSWRRRPFAIVQKTNQDASEHGSFAAALGRLDDLLYDAETGQARVVPLTPTCFVTGTGVHFMSFGGSVAEARETAERATSRFIGNP